MMKLDPIIAVKDVESSARWYQKVFGFRRAHGGGEFAVLVNESNEVMLCLHQWGAHDHPSMAEPGQTNGNGLMLYFRTDNLISIKNNVEQAGIVVEQEIHINPNSLKQEFSFRDPDEYFITVTEYHNY